MPSNKQIILTNTRCRCPTDCCPDCMEGYVRPDTIELDLSIACCVDIASGSGSGGGTLIPLTWGVGTGQPFTGGYWGGYLPVGWCDGHFSATDGSVNVYVGCSVGFLNGVLRTGYWLWLRDGGLHSWFPVQYELASGFFAPMTLISCDPFMVTLGGLAGCISPQCTWTWEAACFVGGTRVKTRRGGIAIANILAGDIILSGDGEQVKVISVTPSIVDEYMVVKIGDSAIGVTKEHPFWNDTKVAFVPIGQCDIGDKLSGRRLMFKRTIQGHLTDVYSLKVDRPNTYMVCDDIVVHNK